VFFLRVVAIVFVPSTFFSIIRDFQNKNKVPTFKQEYSGFLQLAKQEFSLTYCTMRKGRLVSAALDPEKKKAN
jgi:hypothetical protein